MGTSAHGYSKLLNGLILASTLMAVGCSSGGGNGSPASDSSSSSSSSSGAMTDTTPDAFSFAPKRDVEVNTAIDSEAITITGVDAAAPVEITPPAEYQIDDGAFTSERGSVSNNQTITVRLPSAAKAEQTTSATLTVGDQTATFDVITAADMTAPEVAIQFPPPASMTEGDTIYIRGESSDLHGSVANITINGEMVTTEDDYATWSIELPLAEGENTLTVTATDMAGNVNDGEAVSVRRAPITSAFPSDENPFSVPFKVDIGLRNQSLTAFVADMSKPAIFAVDLATGTREVISDNQTQAEPAIDEPQGIHYGENEKLYVSDYIGSVFEVDPNDGVRSLVAEKGSDSYLQLPMGMLFDTVDGLPRLYVADLKRLYWINISNGDQVLLSGANENVPDDLNPFLDIWSLVESNVSEEFYVADVNDIIFKVDGITGHREVFAELGASSSINEVLGDFDRNRLLYLSRNEDRVYEIDLDTRVSTTVSDELTPNSANSLVDAWGMANHPGLGYVVLVDAKLQAVLAMDLDSGLRVVVSKSNTANP